MTLVKRLPQKPHESAFLAAIIRLDQRHVLDPVLKAESFGDWNIDAKHDAADGAGVSGAAEVVDVLGVFKVSGDLPTEFRIDVDARGIKKAELQNREQAVHGASLFFCNVREAA